MNSNIASLIDKLNLGFTRTVPKIIQTEAAECGLACLAMICGYYKYHTDLMSLRQRFNISSNGLNLAQLINIAAALDLKTRPLSLDLDELKELKTPCILHWDLNHFVVLVKVYKNQIIIHDPAFGKRTLSLSEVSKHFTGVALEIWPEASFKPATQRSKLQLLSLIKNITGFKAFLLKLFALSLVIEAINILLPVGTQLVLDHVIIAEDHDLLTLICIGLLFFILFKTIVSVVRSWLTIVTNALINVQWSSSLFEHLVRLPLIYFEKRKLGDIQSRFNSIDTIRTTFTNSVINGVIDGIMALSVLIMMWLYGGWLVWVVLGITAIYISIRLITYNYYRQASEELIVKEAKASSHFMETLYGMNTVKALNLSQTRAGYWLNLKADAINADISIMKLNMFFGGVSTFIATIDQVIILWIGATMVINGYMTLGMFIAFNAYRGQFSERATNLVDLILQLRILTLHSERIADIALTEAEPKTEQIELIKTTEQIQLQVDNLSFSYDALSAPIFSNLKLTIEAGEHVVIVGPSGIGKTTLIKVMAGLLKPTAGSILVNGLDIYNMGIDNYRQYIACVLQDDKLFAGSIEENIGSFDNQLDRDRVIECAKLSNIHQEIMKMAMGYQTLISELGGSLSGGQKQRLLIARALYRQPTILFLDEATSHLDTANEEQINNAITGLNITRITIAHRPSTIAAADRIIDLSEYKITNSSQ